MTRKEAIKNLEHYRYCLDFQFGWFGEDDNKAIDMAIESLQFTEHFDLLKEYQSLQEVVMCKDCKYWQDSEVGVVECPICTRIHDMVFEIGADDYCSKGKRREESEVEE